MALQAMRFHFSGFVIFCRDVDKNMACVWPKAKIKL